MKKEKLLLAAVAGMTLGLTAPSTGFTEEKTDVNCWGVNGCGKSAKCAVTDADIAAVKKLVGDKEYDTKFGKTETHSCGSHAKCGASSKILNWTPDRRGRVQGKGRTAHQGSRGQEGRRQGLTPARAAPRATALSEGGPAAQAAGPPPFRGRDADRSQSNRRSRAAGGERPSRQQRLPPAARLARPSLRLRRPKARAEDPGGRRWMT